MFGWFKKEARNVENPLVPVSAANFIEYFGGAFGNMSSSGVSVNIESALGVPSVWAAVNFLSGTMAGLPMHVYRRKGDGRDRVKGGMGTLFHDAPNDFQSSFDWRKYVFDQVFTGGRAFTYIERNNAGTVVNLFPLDPSKVKVKMEKGRKTYTYEDGRKPIVYNSTEIIDIPFMLKEDGVSHRGPIATMRDVIGQAISATDYGSKFFQNGGVPPFAIEGPFTSPGAIARAGDDLQAAVGKAAKEKRLALAIPAGHSIKSLGVDPEKSQLVETQRFMVEQAARIYSLPPVFLQDLTHGTFSNTEQQDLHFVKHTIRRWVEQFEQELNLKVFGRSSNRLFVEMNLDGLLRGDFKTRMEGYAKGVQNGLIKPNEARRKENLPDDPDGDKLMIQGATVPIGNQMALPLETPQEQTQ